MIFNATSEYKVVFLYFLWITTIFQMNILFKTNKCHHGGPFGSEGPGQLSPLPPLNPTLVAGSFFQPNLDFLLACLIRCTIRRGSFFVRINTFETTYITSRTSALIIWRNMTRLAAYVVAIFNVAWHLGCPFSVLNTCPTHVSFFFFGLLFP